MIFSEDLSPNQKKTKTDVDLSKYATKDKVDNLLNLAAVSPDEVDVFQDRQGKLKSTDLKWTDIVPRVSGAIQGNFVTFSDGGRIRDSGFSIKNITEKIEKSFNRSLKKAGDTMSGELNLGGNKIVVLINPDSAEDAANKQYVDVCDATVDNKLSMLRTEYEAHVSNFETTKKKFQKLNRAGREFYGDVIPPKGEYFVGKPLSEIIGELKIVNTVVGYLSSKISAGVEPSDIKNISLTLLFGKETWTPQNNKIEYDAKVTGIYRLTIISATEFTISTRYDLMATFSRVASVVINEKAKEIFTITPVKTVTLAPYYYCLEFVTELVTAS